jgi:hypothetical protein
MNILRYVFFVYIYRYIYIHQIDRLNDMNYIIATYRESDGP